jgi:hypothetical protein
MRHEETRRTRRRWPGLVTALSLLCSGAVVLSPRVHPAAADPIDSCTTTTGVIVAVDFSHWGGPVVRGCDATITTGYDALHAAGFTTAGDQHDGTAFICRIDDDPPPQDEPCLDTPPVTATWTYWHANPGQESWTFSSAGAMDYQPPPGSVDAWTFGDNSPQDPPAFSPSSVRATIVGPSPTTTTTPASAPPPPTTTPPAAVGGGAVAPSATGTTPTTTAPGAAPSPQGTAAPGSVAKDAKSGSGPTATARTPGASTTTSGSATAGGGGAKGSRPLRIVDAAPASHQPSSPGSPVPLLVGVALAVLLLAGGGLVAWRRRHRPS